MLKEGDTIKYRRDVLTPAHQAGETGDTKVVGKDISLFHARFLLRGPEPFVEIVKPESSAKPKQSRPADKSTNN